MRARIHTGAGTKPAPAAEPARPSARRALDAPRPIAEQGAPSQALGSPSQAPGQRGVQRFAAGAATTTRARLLQRFAQQRGQSTAPGPDAAVERAAGDAGHAVDGAIRSRFEQATGVDPSGARVHTGAASQEAASELSAHAYTVGQDIHFARDRYRPGTPEGDQLLAHELVHTVQQGRAGVGGPQRRLEVSDPSDAAEIEADEIAQQVAGGEGGAGLPAPPEAPPRGPSTAVALAGVIARKGGGAATKPAAPPPQTFDLFGKTFQAKRAADGTLSIAPKKGGADGWTFTQSTATPGNFTGTRSEPQLKYIHAAGNEEAMTERVEIQVPATGAPVVGDIVAALDDPPILQVKLAKGPHGLQAADKTAVSVFSATLESLNYTSTAAFAPVAGDTITLGGLGDALVYSDIQSVDVASKPTVVSGFFYIGEYTRYKTTRGVTNVDEVTDAAKAASFDKLAASGTITAGDATLFKAVATIEAPFSGVQNYDAGILSLGFAQWTIHSDLPKVLTRVPADVMDKYLGKYGLTVGVPSLGTDAGVANFVASTRARANYGVRNKSEGALFLSGKEVVSDALLTAATKLAPQLGALAAQAQSAKADLTSTDKAKVKAAKATIATVAAALKGLPGVKSDKDPSVHADILIAAANAAQAAAQALQAGCVSDETLRANEWVLRFEMLGQDPGAQLAQIQEAKSTLATLLARSWAGGKNSTMLKSHRGQAALLSSYFNNPSGTESGMTSAVSDFKAQKKKEAKAAADAAAAAKKPAPAPSEADWDAFPWPPADARWGTYYTPAAQKQLEDLAVVDMTAGTTDPTRRRGILDAIPD